MGMKKTIGCLFLKFDTSNAENNKCVQLAPHSLWKKINKENNVWYETVSMLEIKLIIHIIMKI